MAPKAITSDLFKNRKEIPTEILEKLIVKGGPVAIKESLKQFGYKENEKVAVPTLVVAGDGRIGGIKWTVLGKASKKVTIKASQLWPEGIDEVYISLEVPEFDTFTFYNKYRNVSVWMDSAELTWTVVKKNEKGKKVKANQLQHHWDQGLLHQTGGVTCLCGHLQPHRGHHFLVQGGHEEELC